MKVCQINNLDISGGAARAAFRLHKELQQNSIDSTMLVQHKESDDNTVIGPQTNIAKAMANLRTPLDHLPKLIYPNRKQTFYHFQWLPDLLSNTIKNLNPDIVHLHWICRGFVNISTLARINKPIVWTLHDMWAFTGGCHYTGSCEGYQKQCGRCPQLGSNHRYDLSWWSWKRKVRCWSKLNLRIVAPSKWMKHCIQKSSLLKNAPVEVIPNGLDLKRYKPMDQSLARGLLGLPENKDLVLFGAINATSDPRKGFQYLQPALHKMKEGPLAKNIEIIVFGSSAPKNAPDFGFPVHYLGRLYDEISIALLYSAVDVFVAPSEQDNLPNTVMEALACGTPVTAFDIGGMPDLIEHKINGYLANPFDTIDFARGIEFVFSQKTKTEAMRRSARKKVETNFEIEKVAGMYRDLYEEVLG